MASIFLGSTLMSSGVSLCPKNLQSVGLNCIFFGFRDRLFSLAVLHSTKTVPSCVFSVALCITMSSVIPSTPGTRLSTLSSLSWKTSPETFKPNGILSHLYLPHRVLNVVKRLLLKSKGMCQNPDVASLTVKYLQGGHGTGKTGNLAVNFSRQGKHREFSKFNFLHRENCGNTGKF